MAREKEEREAINTEEVAINYFEEISIKALRKRGEKMQPPIPA